MPTDYATLTPIALTGDIKALEEAAEGCPACILAAIRLAPWPRIPASEDAPEHKAIPENISAWDFKAALAEWWRNADQAERENRGY